MPKTNILKCPDGNKQIHYSEGKAEAQLRSILKKDPEYTGEIYPCECCKGWHVGREKKKAQKQIQVNMTGG